MIDLMSMTDEELITFCIQQSTLSPLENELARRFESVVGAGPQDDDSRVAELENELAEMRYQLRDLEHELSMLS